MTEKISEPQAFWVEARREKGVGWRRGGDTKGTLQPRATRLVLELGPEPRTNIL